MKWRINANEVISIELADEERLAFHVSNLNECVEHQQYRIIVERGLRDWKDMCRAMEAHGNYQNGLKGSKEKKGKGYETEEGGSA